MTTLIAPTLWILACSPAVADRAAPRLQIVTIEANSIHLQLIAITDDGWLRYRRDGRDGRIALDDVLRILPKTKDAPDPEQPSPRLQTIYLADGGILRANLLPPEGDAPRVLRAHMDRGLIVKVPFEAVAALRTTAIDVPELEKEFQARLASRVPGRDILIVADKQKAVIVPGSLERLTPDGWSFRFGSRTRSAPLDRAYGFVLGLPPTATTPLPASIALTNGNRFTAKILVGDSTGVTVDAGLLGELTIGWPSVRSVELRSERMVHVSDLEPIQTDHKTLIGADWPPRNDRNVTGGPIRLAGRTYAKGLGVHAYTALSYKLGGAFERFSAVVGIDDSITPKGGGSVVFRIKGDGRVLFVSNVVRGGDAPLSISIDVSGVNVLTLECDYAVDLDLSDHADWANAILIRAKGSQEL